MHDEYIAKWSWLWDFSTVWFVEYVRVVYLGVLSTDTTFNGGFTVGFPLVVGDTVYYNGSYRIWFVGFDNFSPSVLFWYGTCFYFAYLYGVHVVEVDGGQDVREVFKRYGYIEDVFCG